MSLKHAPSGSETDERRLPRRILVGHDGSASAEDAVELARLLTPSGGELLLVDVLPNPGTLGDVHRRLVEDPNGPEPRADPLRLPERKVGTLAFVGGSPARVLTELAETEDFDAVVIGSPHRAAVGRAQAGSVAHGLMHGCPIPTLCAPRDYRMRKHRPIRRIAVAFDGSAESKLALEHADALAADRGASLMVLTVEPSPEHLAASSPDTFRIPPDRDSISRQAEALISEDVFFERRVLDGPIVAAIASACNDEVDLLFCGSRGYGPFGRVLMGSTSSALIREARCPVVVVPRRKGRGERASERSSHPTAESVPG